VRLCWRRWRAIAACFAVMPTCRVRRYKCSANNVVEQEIEMKRLMALIVAAAVLTLAGCNTVHGFGQDVEKLGDKIQKKSD
jgi:entericidin A